MSFGKVGEDMDIDQGRCSTAVVMWGRTGEPLDKAWYLCHRKEELGVDTVSSS